MAILILPHSIDVEHRAGWLWYSHASFGPMDRQVVSDVRDQYRPGLKMAQHYFLTDDALAVLNGSPYTLRFLGDAKWELTILQRPAAVLFKLKWG